MFLAEEMTTQKHTGGVIVTALRFIEIHRSQVNIMSSPQVWQPVPYIIFCFDLTP